MEKLKARKLVGRLSWKIAPMSDYILMMVMEVHKCGKRKEGGFDGGLTVGYWSGEAIIVNAMVTADSVHGWLQGKQLTAWKRKAA